MNEEQFFRMQNSKFYRFFNRVSQIIVVNLCAILVAFCGLIVFGIFPVIFAATAFFNKELEQRTQKTLPTMFRYFKKYFWIGNALMLITVGALASGIYIVFCGHELHMVLYLIIMTFMIVAILLNLYLPSVTVLYPEFSFRKKFVFSFVAACDRWKTTMILMILYVIWIYASALLPQFGMWCLFSLVPWFSIFFIKKALKPETIVDPTAPIPEEYFFGEKENEEEGIEK